MARSTTFNRRIRLRLVLAVMAVVVVGLWLSPSRSGAADAPPMPERVKFVLHLDLDRLRGSELYEAAAEQLAVLARSNEMLQMFLQATGLQDKADSLQSFTLYSFADEEKPQAFAGIIEADFPATTMSRLERAYAPVAREVGGRVIMPVIQTPDMELVMAFLGGGRLSFGTARAVETLVDDARRSLNLLDAFGQTETRRPIWGLIDAEAAVQTLLRAGEVSGADAQMLEALRDNPALNSVTAIGFSIDFGKDIFFELRALTSNADSARLLADAIKGLLALGQLGVSQVRDPDLYELVRQIVAESDRDGVYVSFKVGENQIERLKAIGDPLGELLPK